MNATQAPQTVASPLLSASDASDASEVAPPCVEAVLTLDDVYEDTDILPPPPDLRADPSRPAAGGADGAEDETPA